MEGRALEEGIEAELQRRSVLQFALPHGEDFPAIEFELKPLGGIAVPGARALGFPELGVCLGCVLAHPAVVEMPEAAVDEDDFAAGAKSWRRPAAAGQQPRGGSDADRGWRTGELRAVVAVGR